MNTLEKTRTILLFFIYLLVMMVKWVAAKFVYPFAYVLKDWVYGDDEIHRYKLPDGVKKNWVKWFFWLFLDGAQPIGYSDKYGVRVIGHEPETKWEKFWASYRWSAIRNPAYNVNRVYLSTWSEVIECEKVFGKYECKRKLRAKNGDKGIQFVWFKTEKGQVRFLFSASNPKLPVTFFFRMECTMEGDNDFSIKI